MSSITRNFLMTFLVIDLFMLRMMAFLRGGQNTKINSQRRDRGWGQNSYISENLHYHRYSLFLRRGPNSIANFDGGHARIGSPWIRHWARARAAPKSTPMT